jgi:hypothetical protein
MYSSSVPSVASSSSAECATSNDAGQKRSISRLLRSTSFALPRSGRWAKARRANAAVDDGVARDDDDGGALVISCGGERARTAIGTMAHDDVNAAIAEAGR